MKHLSFIVCLTLLLSLLVFTSCETYEVPNQTESEAVIESEGSDTSEDATTVTDGDTEGYQTYSDSESVDTSTEGTQDTSVDTPGTEGDTEGEAEGDTEGNTESDTESVTESDTEADTESDTEDDSSEDDNTVTLPWLDV